MAEPEFNKVAPAAGSDQTSRLRRITVGRP